MKLYCDRNNRVILENIIIARDFFTRFRGLMLKKNLSGSEGMLLTPCNGIHTLFMRFPIDVVFLDSEYTVIKIIPDMKPNRFSPFVKGASHVLEIAANSSETHDIKEGDRLSIVNS